MTYRFRLVTDPARLPDTSGNFVYLRWRGAAAQVFCCGAVHSLTVAGQSWDATVRAYGALGLYIRLNVARTTRDEEHADLMAKYRPPMPAYLDA